MPPQGLAGLCVSVIPVVLLALVTFNTPYLKSLSFLDAKYAGFQASFGTLGYCTTGGTAVTNGTAAGADGCVGPTIGYTFDPDTIFGVSNSLFNIPTVVTKYLTYVLFLHAVALIFAVLALFFSALAMIPTFSVACFPALCAWLTSFLTLISFIIDVVMFYIAKARIDKVSGASATIGVCVWITLAAWLVTGILGCVIGVGNCCTACTRRDQATSRKSRYEAMEQDHHQQRRDDDDAKRRETEIPTTIPKLYGDDDDYKMNHYGSQQRSVQPESFIDGVGYGYGHRARTSEEHLLNNGQPRQVTPPPTDRGYVPSATAYPLTRSPQPPQPYGDPYAASHPEEMLASHSSGSAVQNPYGNTPFPASSSNNLAPGPPTNLHRSMTPASTYAGSFVGVGSGRHDGMPMPAMPENAVAGAAAYGATGGAAVAAGGMYAAGRQVRQGSGHEAQQPYSVYGDTQYGHPSQHYPAPHNPYAANTTLMRPRSDEEQRSRQTMIYDQPPRTQDAYGGYETPTANAYATQHQAYPHQPSNHHHHLPPVAPQPQRLVTQGVNAPSFPLDHVTSPTSHSHTSPPPPPPPPNTGYGQGPIEVERAQDMGPADAPPPQYHEHGVPSAIHGSYPPQAHYAGNSTKAGYFH